MRGERFVTLRAARELNFELRRAGIILSRRKLPSKQAIEAKNGDTGFAAGETAGYVG